MSIRERQRRGALTFLIVSLTVYGAMLSYQPLSGPQFCIPWGDMMPGTLAVQVFGSPSSDGIYFFPLKMSLPMIRRETGLAGEVRPYPRDTFLNDDSAAISIEGSTQTICAMPATTKLALGIPIDINHASAEEISLVPGMGKKLGHLIFQLRVSKGKIASLSELTAVPGIKEKKLSSLRKYLTVGSSQ